jgi:hypothetical protein
MAGGKWAEESYENNIYLKDSTHNFCSILSEPAIFLVVMMIFHKKLASSYGNPCCPGTHSLG